MQAWGAWRMGAEGIAKAFCPEYPCAMPPMLGSTRSTHRRSEFFLQLSQHVRRHLRQVILDFETPLLCGAGGVDGIRPAVGDGLAFGIDSVIHHEVRDVLLDLCRNHFWCDA